jgi:hypothetical protein
MKPNVSIAYSDVVYNMPSNLKKYWYRRHHKSLYLHHFRQTWYHSVHIALILLSSSTSKRPVAALILHPALTEQIAHSRVEENEQWRADILKVTRGRASGPSMLRLGDGAS